MPGIPLPNAALLNQDSQFAQQVGATNGVAAQMEVEIGSPTVVNGPVSERRQDGQVFFMGCDAALGMNKEVLGPEKANQLRFKELFATMATLFEVQLE